MCLRTMKGRLKDMDESLLKEKYEIEAIYRKPLPVRTSVSYTHLDVYKRQNVDLPLPEVPTTATNSPCSTVKFTPSRARVMFGSVP